MKCPRCGADNSDRAIWCYLCEYPFGDAAQGEGLSGAPREPAQPSYQQSDQVPDYPPGQLGYPPPVPGTYPPGYRATPPATGPDRSRTLIILVAVLGALAFVGAIVLAVIFLARGESVTINVPPPPGYTEPSEKEIEAVEASIKAGSPDVSIDKVYIAQNSQNIIIVAHHKESMAGMPSDDDPEKIEEFYYENKDEVMDDLLLGLEETPTVEGDIELYEVEELGSGDTALHLKIGFTTFMASMTADMFIVVKGNTVFLVMVEGSGNYVSPETVEFLRQNISFG